MLEHAKKPRSLRVLLYLGLVGISLTFALTGFGLRKFVEARLSEQSEAQVRALSRHRAQQALVQALLDEEVGLRGFLATGDARFLDSYYQGTRDEADALRNTLDNVNPEDQEAAQSQIDRLRAMVDAWHEQVADPLVRERSRAPLPDLRTALAKEKKSFETIRAASDALLRFLDERDNVRLVAVEEALAAARWLSLSAMGVVFLLGLGVSRWILRQVADPLVELADAARMGAGFPEPERLSSVREVEVLGQALYDLDIRVREREQTLRQDQAEAQSIREFTELAQRIDREEDLLAVTEQALRRLTHADGIRILLRPETGDGLEACLPPLDAEEAAKHRILQDAMACRAIQTGTSIALESRAPTACLCPLGVPTKGEYLCIPLLASGRALGLVNLQSQVAGRSLAGQRRLAESCISVAAAALQALRALKLAKEQAIRDGLTGAYNRRFLDEVLRKEMDQAQRRQQPFSVLMLDIDHFKQFNDTFGHEAGDRVLRLFVRTLLGQVRVGDLVARYGGEEFTILLPHTAHAEALALAERLRAKVESLHLPEPEFPKGCRITTSVGAATFPEHGEDLESLMGAADKALYGAKGKGRNRVVGAGDISL